MNTLAFTPEESQALKTHGYNVAGHMATMSGHVGDASGHNHTIQVHKSPRGIQVKHQQKTRNGVVTHHSQVHPDFNAAMKYVQSKSPTRTAAPKLSIVKREKDWKLEVIEKMSATAAGTLKNGKKFYAEPSHPAHKTFSGQEHAEAAKILFDQASSALAKGERVDGTLTFAKCHAIEAKAKGLPKHNNPKR